MNPAIVHRVHRVHRVHGTARNLALAAALASPFVLGAAGDAYAASASPPADPGELVAAPPANDGGRRVELRWSPSDHGDGAVLVFRAPAPTESSASPTLTAGDLAPLAGKPATPGITVGRWRLIATVDPDESTYVDDIAGDAPGDRGLVYAVVNARLAGDDQVRVDAMSAPSISSPVSPRAALFNTGRWFFFLIIALMGGAIGWYVRRVRRDPDSVYVRRIPGVDVIEEAVGRATEMGRPVLYVTGSDELQNIQTIASLLILGHVAEIVADYDTEIEVVNRYPLVMVVAEEIVRQSFINAGRLDAHKPDNVMFISSELFAFVAGINGMILRDKPAANIYMGAFFAESLILAETGYLTKAIQIAGTARITQLPFFIAACDYTIIGEELYAVSSYLSREPSLLAMLKSTDLVKACVMVVLLIGTFAATVGWFEIGPHLIP